MEAAYMNKYGYMSGMADEMAQNRYEEQKMKIANVENRQG